ncbi:MAG: binding-protein dependent transport system inner rane protein [Candidatus Taylorbacteria bacterium]|nr:binding-protein dependent transport system inner rane protein [Candidatus Taylorbacteria bacterium]
MRSVRFYHPFSTSRSRQHLLALAGILVLPLILLGGFSAFTKMNFIVLINDLGISLARMFWATIISIVLGWLFAVLFYHGRRARIALPIFDVLQSLPTSAALPVAVIYFGASNFVVIVSLIFAIIWPIFFSIISSLKLIRHDWVEAVEVSRIKGFDYLRYFLVPVSIPGLITGTIIGLGDGWEALVATEIIVHVHIGLGNFFSTVSANPTATVLGIVCLLSVIFAINKSIWLPLLERSHKIMEE